MDLEQAADTTIFLRRPPFWNVLAIAVVVVCGAGLWEVLKRVWVMRGLGAQVPPSYYASALLFVLIGASLLGLLAWRRRRPLPPIRFSQNAIEMPTSLHGTGITSISYADVLSLHMGGGLRTLRVFIESSMRVFAFEQRYFVRENGHELLFKELRRRILDLEDGERRMAAMREREGIATQTMGQRPWATQTLLGILAVVFFNLYREFAGDPRLGDSLALLEWGAGNGLLVRSGEWFRLFSANLLHANLAHIVVNGIALFSLGSVVERFFGWQRYLVIYLGAGLGGVALSFAAGDYTVSVGASCCIAGVFGALLSTNLYYRTRLPLGFRQPLRWWLFIAGINILLPILIPLIDVAGHVGGFVAGALLALPFLRHTRDVLPAERVSLATTVGCGVLIVGYTLGFGSALWGVSERSPESRLALTRTFLDHPPVIESADEQFLNLLAWEVATSELVTPADLGQAVLASQASLARKDTKTWRTDLLFLFFPWLEDELAYQAPLMRRQLVDTLATLRYRQGRFAEAIEIERSTLEEGVPAGAARQALEVALRSQAIPVDGVEALWTGLHEVMGTQLMRFIAAAKAAQADVAGLVPGAVAGLTVTIERPSGPPQLVLRLDAPDRWGGGGVAYFRVLRGDQPSGLLLVGLGAGVAGEVRHKPSTDLTFTKDTTLELLLIDPEAPPAWPIPAGEVHWRIYRRSSAFDGYP